MGLLFLWALSILAAFMVARHMNTASLPRVASVPRRTDGPPSAGARSAPVKAPRPVTKVVYVDREVPVEAPPVFGEVLPGYLDSASIRRYLPAALAAGGDELVNNLVVAQLLAGLDADSISTALAVFEGAPRNQMNDQYFRMFMYAWGKIDGQAATEYAFFNEEGRKVPYAGWQAMRAWGGQDPAAARTYIESLGDDNRHERYMTEALVRGWAVNDLAAASEYATGLADPSSRRRLVDFLADEHMKQQGSAGALRWAEAVAASHEDGQYAGRMLTEVAVRAAREDAFTAREWLERNLDSEFLNPRMFEEVADELAAIDPAAAAAFLDRHFEDARVNGKVIAEMTEEWTRKDPVAAAAWVNRYLGHEKINQEVVYELAGEWAARDPVSAIEWVAGLEDEALKRRGLASAVGHWARHDATAAGNWLNQQSRSSGLYDPAIETYVNRIAREHPLAALSWAQEIEDVERWERASVRAGQALLRQDREAVTAWLPGSGLSETAQRAVLNLSRHDHR